MVNALCLAVFDDRGDGKWLAPLRYQIMGAILFPEGCVSFALGGGFCRFGAIDLQSALKKV